jgi:hypothetical protein
VLILIVLVVTVLLALILRLFGIRTSISDL